VPIVRAENYGPRHLALFPSRRISYCVVFRPARPAISKFSSWKGGARPAGKTVIATPPYATVSILARTAAILLDQRMGGNVDGGRGVEGHGIRCCPHGFTVSVIDRSLVLNHRFPLTSVTGAASPLPRLSLLYRGLARQATPGSPTHGRGVRVRAIFHVQSPVVSGARLGFGARHQAHCGAPSRLRLSAADRAAHGRAELLASCRRSIHSACEQTCETRLRPIGGPRVSVDQAGKTDSPEQAHPPQLNLWGEAANQSACSPSV